MTLLARLDKSETRVLCGVVDCGAEVARVVDVERGNVTLPLRSVRAVWFGPGWHPREDGVWALTARAARELRRQHMLGGGRLLGARGRPGETKLKRAFAFDGDRYQVENHQTGPAGWLPENLPADVVCSVCGSRQTLAPATLRVTANRRPGTWPSTKLPGQTGVTTFCGCF